MKYLKSRPGCGILLVPTMGEHMICYDGIIRALRARPRSSLSATLPSLVLHILKSSHPPRP